MSLLTRYSTPAERNRGCRWADRFESQALVEQNGGAVTGAPVFSVENGVTLDGAADYLDYDLAGTEFDSDPISIVVDFSPSVDYTFNANLALIDSTAGQTYLVMKRNNASSNGLLIFLGNTSVVTIAQATYGPLWLTNQRNSLTISSTSGDTDVWLNGTQILSNHATAWNPDQPPALRVGADIAGASFFPGTIHSVQVYKAKLTAQEAADFYNRSAYNYLESALGIWQCRSEDHDPTNTQTLDSSGNGNHLTLVSAPPKISDRHGYRFDGATDGFSRADDNTFDPGTNPFSIIAHVKPNALAGYIINKGWAGSYGWGLGLTGTGQLYSFVSANGVGVQDRTTNNCFRIGTESVVVMAYDPANTEFRVYVDEITDTRAGVTNNVWNSTHILSVGATSSGAGRFPGDLLYVAYIEGVTMTPLQVEDAKVMLRKKRNVV